MENYSESATSMTRDRMMAVQLAARNRALRGQLDAILRSRSWALTSPLRKMMAWMKSRGSHTGWRPASLVEAESGRTSPLDICISKSADNRVETRWLIDVTDLALHEFHAGVQRVSLQLLSEWLIAPPPGVRVEPVRLATGGVYCHARRYLAALVGENSNRLGVDALVEPRSSDRFLGLDLLRDYAEDYGTALGRLKDAGVDISILVHDVLPLSNPDWFPPEVAPRFERWFEISAEMADRFLCISEYTRNATTRALRDRGLPSPRDGLHVFPLGTNLPNWPTLGHDTDCDRKNFRVLSVGTVEVRKGCGDILEAMETLWDKGVNIEWTLVGAPGWGVQPLIKQLNHHRESGVRLHWHQNADDARLRMLYRKQDLLVSASYGEGYGLPIAEAAAEGLPLLLRDVPIFHEVAGAGAAYFGGSTELGLSQALESIIKIGNKISPRKNWPTWADSARFLQQLLATSTSAGVCNESR